MKLAQRSEMTRVVNKCPQFLYLSRPRPGETRYVFEDTVKLTLSEAFLYAQFKAEEKK